MPRGTHPPLKSYGLKRACIGPRSSCLGTEAIRRGLKAAAAMGGAEDGGALSWAFCEVFTHERSGGYAIKGRTRRGGACDAVAQSTRKSNENLSASIVYLCDSLIEVNESSQHIHVNNRKQTTYAFESPLGRLAMDDLTKRDLT